MNRVIFFSSSRADFWLLVDLVDKTKTWCMNYVFLVLREVAEDKDIMEVLERHNVGYITTNDDHHCGARGHVRETAVSRLALELLHVASEDVISFCSDDCLVVLGDRYETFGVALAAKLSGSKVIHLHGGEWTPNSMDNNFRFWISSMASAHFVASSRSKRRLIDAGVSGEVILSGGFVNSKFSQWKQAGGRIYDWPNRQHVVVVYHPNIVLDGESPSDTLTEILAGVDARCSDEMVYILSHNRDPGSNELSVYAENLFKDRRYNMADSLAQSAYFDLLASARFLIGNSSSGMLESVLFETPVINVGSRQLGRERSGYVIDVPPDRARITSAIDQVNSEASSIDWNAMKEHFYHGNPSSIVSSWLRAGFDE